MILSDRHSRQFCGRRTLLSASVAFILLIVGAGNLMAVEPEDGVSDDSAPAIAESADDSPETPGIAIGQEAPKFSLSDQDGETVELSKLLEQHNVALVFFRSADW